MAKSTTTAGRVSRSSSPIKRGRAGQATGVKPTMKQPGQKGK